MSHSEHYFLFDQEKIITKSLCYVSDGPDNPKIFGPEEVHVGTTLTLSCSAESVPTATYTWKHNGTIVVQSHEYTKNNVGFSDSGEYICQATNDMLMKSSETSLTVHVTGLNFSIQYII